MPSPEKAKFTNTRGTASGTRAMKETGLSSPSTGRAIISTKDTLTTLARTDSTAENLIPLITSRLLDPFVSFAQNAYDTADKVLKKTPHKHFVIADTVFNGQPHVRGLSEARVLLMDRVVDELEGKLKGEGGVSEEKIEGWRKEGCLGDEMVRKWLGEILDDMGGDGW
jgi:hypothetical protein